MQHRIRIGERQRAWGHDFSPTSFTLGNCARTFPWSVCARFAAGVGQLHSGYASLFMNKTDDSTQHLDVLVAPDAEILRTDATLGKNGGCLSQHQSGATHRTAAEMNDMPVVSESVAA